MKVFLSILIFVLTLLVLVFGSDGINRITGLVGLFILLGIWASEIKAVMADIWKMLKGLWKLM